MPVREFRNLNFITFVFENKKITYDEITAIMGVIQTLAVSIKNNTELLKNSTKRQ